MVYNTETIGLAVLAGVKNIYRTRI